MDAEFRLYFHYNGQPSHTLVVTEDTLRKSCLAFLRDYELISPSKPFATTASDITLTDENGTNIDMDTPIADIPDRSDVFLSVSQSKEPSAASFHVGSQPVVPSSSLSRQATSGERAPHDRPQFDAVVATCVDFLGKAREAQNSGHVLQARNLYQSGLDALNSCKGVTPEQREATSSLRLSFQQQLGVILARTRFWDRARDAFLESVALAEPMHAKLNSKSPDYLQGTLNFARLNQFLGQSQFETKDIKAAAKCFEKALSILDTLPKDETTRRQIQDCQVWLARSLYNRSEEGKRRAIALYELSLKENENHIETLLHYALVAIDHGQQQQSLPFLLRALVQASQQNSNNATQVDSDTYARIGAALAKIVSGPNGVTTLLRELHSAVSAPSALVFLAQTVKDHGAIEAANMLYEKALNTPGAERKSSLALALLHTQEVTCEYQKSFDNIQRYFAEHAEAKIGANCRVKNICEGMQFIKDISAAELRLGTANYVPPYQPPPSIFDANESHGSVGSTKRTVASKCTYDDEELNLLAMFFTAIKLLYICGGLQPLCALIARIEPLRVGQELHTTLIRNEHAYYSCVAQIMHHVTFPIPDHPQIYVVGDSHCLPLGWQAVNLPKPHLLVPKLVTGLKCWHLRDECDFYPKKHFENVMRTIPAKATVIFVFGEIDCREGLLEAVERCKYDSIEEGIEVDVQIYIKALEAVVKAKQLRAFVHPVIPVLDITRKVVKIFNASLQPALARSKVLQWMDFFPQLLSEDQHGFNTKYSLDGTHMSPAYVPLVEQALKVPHKFRPFEQ